MSRFSGDPATEAALVDAVDNATFDQTRLAGNLFFIERHNDIPDLGMVVRGIPPIYMLLAKNLLSNRRHTARVYDLLKEWL